MEKEKETILSPQEEAKRLVSDITSKLNQAIQPVVTSFPATPAMALVVAMTLIRIGVRLVRLNGVDMQRFVMTLEKVLRNEFTSKEASQPERELAADGKPLIVLTGI